ncbi:MAG: PAS domain S-box protein [Deltaproteobacteria bacterium]|nr:PAS domain S-box protein [Deltaproteobacteria bacterium]MBN2670949.1 PAS domain S-box protein [Deltaproteobacteria bacterium]
MSTSTEYNGRCFDTFESQKKMLDHIVEVVLVIDANRTVRFHNASIERLFGWTPQEVVGNNVLDYIHPDDIASARIFLDGVMATPGQMSTEEFRYLTKAGTYKWIQFHAVNMLDDPDIRGVLGNYNDITIRKDEEAKRLEAFDLLTNLAKLVPGVIYQYRLDPDGQSAFPYASPGMIDIYEVTPEEVREDASPVFSRLHPEDIEAVSSKIIESARTLENFYCEFRVILPEKGLQWRWSQAFPERIENGGTLWHGIIMDITERKEAEAEQEKLKQQLTQSQKMESVGRLAGGIAHDFNNMLGVMMGHAEMLLDQVHEDNICHQGLSQILFASQRSADLTRQLLTFARQQTIRPVAVQLNEVITEARTMLTRLIGEGIHIDLKLAGDLGLVALDPGQLQQILINFSVNSRDAMDGSGAIRIETANDSFESIAVENDEGPSEGSFVRLTFTDTGPGMSPEVRKNLFEPFFTTKPLGRGTGLGLSTVYGIVKQNNGFIRVDSEPGKGATFHVYFREHIPSLEKAVSSSDKEPVYLDNATILLVEDEPILLSIVTKMLEGAGHTVLPANNPNEAIEIARVKEGEIHLLLSDVIMPGMNGRQLADIIVELRPRIRCTFMSGYTADVIGPHGVLDRNIMFIPKPFTKQQLLGKVKESLGVRLKVW